MRSTQASDPEAGLGLRERKKRKTRLAISQVATSLFIARGFDRVTVAEVAAAAEVSVNTVFNYFSTKEELFFDRAEEFELALANTLKHRRPDESPLDVLERAFRGFARETGAAFNGRNFEPFLATVEASPTLKAYLRVSQERAEAHLARTLAASAGLAPDDLQARTFAALVMGLVRLLTQEFTGRVLRGERADRYVPALVKLFEAGFRQLREGTADFGVSPGRSPRKRR